MFPDKILNKLKILYKTLEKTIADGLEQTWKYMDKSGADSGHLIIFDRSEDKSWDDKIFYREEIFEKQTISVWGM